MNKPHNDYFRMIVTNEDQTTYSSPKSDNSNLPSLGGYNYCRLIVEKCIVKTRAGNDDEISYLTIGIKNYTALNQSLAQPIGSTSSNVIEVVSGVQENYGATAIFSYNFQKRADEDAGIVIPTNVLQNNNFELELKYADGTLITEPDVHSKYIIVLGIKLIK
jgi:hypothetical protein